MTDGSSFDCIFSQIGMSTRFTKCIHLPLLSLYTFLILSSHDTHLNYDDHLNPARKGLALQAAKYSVATVRSWTGIAQQQFQISMRVEIKGLCTSALRIFSCRWVFMFQDTYQITNCAHITDSSPRGHSIQRQIAVNLIPSFCLEIKRPVGHK